MSQAQTYESQARQQHLRDYLSRGGSAGQLPPELLSSPGVQSMRGEAAQREAKLAEMSKRLGPNHPQYQALQGDLDRMKQQLNQEMHAAAQGLVASTGAAGQSEGAIRGQLEAQRAKVFKMKSDRVTLAMMLQEV